MTEWKRRRFWREAKAVETPEGYGVFLDNRPVRTPAKAKLEMPSRTMAEAVAAEWASQQDVINPMSMPVTRAVNAAIDKVAPQKADVAELIAAYADTDLTCYRAGEPEALAARQAQAWDPLLDWADRIFGARLIPVQGVVHRAQHPVSLERLGDAVRSMTVFELTALSNLVGLSGSLVLGLAAAHGAKAPATLWNLSRIDEIWQEEHWGVDAEAANATEARRRDFLAAHRFYRLAQNFIDE